MDTNEQTQTQVIDLELVNLQGQRGISRRDALAFLDGKRSLLDIHSRPKDYFDLAAEYASIQAWAIARELFDAGEAISNKRV